MSKSYDRILAYFSRDVLTVYRASPHLYELEEDDMGGKLELADNGNDGDEWFQVRFGFRRQADGIVCLATVAHDLKHLPDKDRMIWVAYLLDSVVFAEVDPSFDRWVNRNLEGSWEVDDGPKQRIQREIHLVCAMTQQFLGLPLWRYRSNRLINYPVSENTDAYVKAHLELYRLVIDGFDPKAIVALAERRGVKLTDHSRTLGSLRESLPDRIAKAVYDPLAKCRDQRNRNHGGLDEPVKRFAAFDSFHRDVERLAAGLRALREWLESEFSADAEACLSRYQTFARLFPKFIGPPRPELKAGELERVVGKTISRVEFGEEEPVERVHRAEGIILHFSDGSAVSIRIGSNAGNISDEFDGLKAEHFSTDLMIFWAPSGNRMEGK